MTGRNHTSRRRSLLWALMGSATFHVIMVIALLAGASSWLASRERSDTDSRSASTSSGDAGADDDDATSPGQAPADDLAERDPAALTRLMQDQAAEADRLDDAQRLERLESQSAWLAQRDAAGVQSAAQRITRFAGGSTGRKLAPDPEATGAFDSETSVLHDISKRTEADGRVVYDWTLVDHEGRSVVTTMDAQQMSRQDLAAARVFEMTRSNPNLRTLVDAAQSIIASKPQATSASDAMPR